MPTRLLLDHPNPTDEPAGSTLQISGTAQYRSTDGVWHAFSSANISLQDGSTWLSGADADANGRFTVPVTIPDQGGTWTLNVDNPPWYAAAPTPFTFTVDQQLQLSATAAAVDAAGQLSFNATATSSNGHFPANRVYIQVSPDGRTGWKSIGYIPLTGNVTNLHATGPASDPHGYWRLYSPAAPGFSAATGNVVHAFRYATGITGGRPNVTTIGSGGTLTFTGALWQQGTGPWKAMPGATVALMYEPAGSSHWYLAGTTRTASSGAFTLTPATPGTWSM
ncbi:hypothetical protein GXW82_31325 [Streptacidiphilus sp. 4-A2]|nr:hypothetical protein [Streptacidiphilus sp. 4-A2]